MSTLVGLLVHPRADSFRCPTDTWRGYVKLCAIRNVNVSREDSWPTIPMELGELDDVLYATRRFHRRGLLICLLSFDRRPRLFSTSLSRLRDTYAGNAAFHVFFHSRGRSRWFKEDVVVAIVSQGASQSGREVGRVFRSISKEREIRKRRKRRRLEGFEDEFFVKMIGGELLLAGTLGGCDEPPTTEGL